jgi:hypothetical protein
LARCLEKFGFAPRAAHIDEQIEEIIFAFAMELLPDIFYSIFQNNF